MRAGGMFRGKSLPAASGQRKDYPAVEEINTLRNVGTYIRDLFKKFSYCAKLPFKTT